MIVYAVERKLVAILAACRCHSRLMGADEVSISADEVIE